MGLPCECKAVSAVVKLTWPQGQLAIHDHIVQVLLLQVMHLASKLPPVLTGQKHWPPHLAEHSTLDYTCQVVQSKSAPLYLQLSL